MLHETVDESSQLATLPGGWQRILAVAAHPDDLEYEAGGAIALWTAQGKSVGYLLASRGEAGIDGLPPQDAAVVREAEQRSAAAILGVKDLTFLDHKDGVIEYSSRLRRDIAAAIRRYKPDLIVAQNHHYFWPGRQHLNMADHRAVGLATLDAARDAANRWIFPELADEGLEPWTGVRGIAIACSPNATHAVDVTDGLDLAVTALREHKVYLDDLVDDDLSGDMADPEAWMRMLALQAGKRFGGRLAATFELIEI